MGFGPLGVAKHPGQLINRADAPTQESLHRIFWRGVQIEAFGGPVGVDLGRFKRQQVRL